LYDLLDLTIRFGEQKGASQVEAFFAESQSLSAQIERGQVKSIDSKFDAGIGARVILRKNGKIFLGSACTMDAGQPGIKTMVDEAISVALAKPEQKELKSFHDSMKVQTVNDIFDPRIPAVEPVQACELARNMIESASLSKSVVAISGDLLFISYRTAVRNSLGVETGYSSTIFKASSYVTTKNETSVGSAGDNYSSRVLDEEKAIEVGRHSASMAISQLNPKSIGSGVMDLVIGSDAIADLLENTFASMIRADQVQRNQSPYVGKMGSEVASDMVTIVDQGRIPGAVGSKPYDDEGYPTQTTPIVEKGILKSYLYNVSAASKEDRESTGNGIRPSSGDSVAKYLAEPSVAHTNLMFQRGDEDFESILSSVKTGIYVRHVIGAHTANRVTGEFSVAPLIAYKVEKGEIKHAVKEAMIGANIQNVLRNVTAISRHSKQCQGMLLDTAIISPIVKVEKISVGA
jgi:PmbA protein